MLILEVFSYSCLPAVRHTNVREAGLPMGYRAAGLLDGDHATIPVPILPVWEEASRKE
jgi:hypothetical protein